MKSMMKRIGKRISDWPHGVVKPHQPHPPCIKDGTWRIVKSSDGIYGLEQYQGWMGGWRFSGVSFESEEAARYTKERFERDEERAKILRAKDWIPINEA